jgi:hypothetical protein
MARCGEPLPSHSLFPFLGAGFRTAIGALPAQVHKKRVMRRTSVRPEYAGSGAAVRRGALGKERWELDNEHHTH